VLPITVPVLPRPAANAKLCYFKLVKHLNLEPMHWDASEGARALEQQGDDDEGGTNFVVRWRHGRGGQRESNARVVEWSDGSMTLHVGDKPVFEVLQAPLERNVHHLVAKQGGASKTEGGESLAVAEAHGVLTHKLSIKTLKDSEVQRSIHNSIVSSYRPKVDKSEVFVKKHKAYDEKEERENLMKKEQMRIRNSSRLEARERGRSNDGMTADYLDRAQDGDVGGMINSFKRQRKQPDEARLRRAKMPTTPSSEEASSSSDSDSYARRKGRKPAASSDSSSSGDEDEVVVKKPKPAARKRLSDSDSD